AVPQNYTQIQLAQADVQTKILNLQTVQDNLATVLAGPDSLTMAKGRASVSQAQVSLRQAQEDLQKAQTPDPVTVAQMQANVAIAQGSLAQAQETLNTVKAGADPNDVAAKQLQRDSAKANLDDIQTQLASATMVAPLEGAVSAVNIKAGQNVTANAIAISIVDTSAPEISAFVSEADISRVKQGQSARVTLDSLPGVSVSGSVASVGLVGRTSSGVVSYPITVRVTPPQGAVVREGMTASVTLVVQQMSNVMVVPNRAIGGSTRNPTVTVMVNGVAQETPVTLGLADDSNTEVKSGIKQGDMVVVSTSGAASRQGFFNSGGGGIGGGVIPGLPGGR
ncbi:MAG: efflux RND transporter periplasmic adaptor subunit, partial [Dehalococcoidia bacterium]|nr:efflux RND transporter periplasmic adaptor subunit [Dehalococcoidia bacterium]